MTIRLGWHGRLAGITLDRPPLNVLDLDHLDQLAAAVESAGEAAVLRIDGGDARCFCAGNDVKDHTRDRAPAMLASFHRAIRGLLETDAVTVADVAGDALGGGCEIAAACDIVCSAPGVRFGQPEIDVGCFPPAAASLLPRRIGWGRAVLLIAAGRRIDAKTAAEWGLVTEVTEAGAGPVIEELLAKSPAVLRRAKAALRAARDLPLTDGIAAAERVYLDQLLPLDDCAEGVRAFLEKRPPDWSS